MGSYMGRLVVVWVCKNDEGVLQCGNSTFCQKWLTERHFSLCSNEEIIRQT